MNTHLEAKGNCLCGKVSLQTQSASSQVHACHCSTCRNWTGGPLFAVDCNQAVTISGEEHIATYRSSDWAERAFCTHCGTHLFSRLIENRQYFIPAGLLGLDSGLEFAQEFFIDRKPHYYEFSNDTTKLTGEELFALFTTEAADE